MAQSGIAVPAFHAGYTTPNSEALMRLLSALFAGVTLALLAAAAADAAEIKIMAPRAVWTVLNVAGPDFERATGNKLNVSVDLAADVVRRVNAGEAFDLAIMPGIFIDDLTRSKKIAAGSRVDLAKSGIGVAVRAGAPKPDISSGEALKRALLAAGSIAYSSSASGIYLAGLFMDIADALKARIKQSPPGTPVGELIARGEAEIGFQQVS